MGKFLALAAVILTALGCHAVGNVASITSQEDVVREGPFEFRYPKDWKITAEERSLHPNQKSTILKFRHPKNRDCYILIEILDIPSSGASLLLQDVVALEARFFKQIFKRAGYDFTFRTTTTALSGQNAARLVMSGQKDNIKRTAVSHIAAFKNHFYIVTYQWYSPWGLTILNRLESIAGTFQFMK